MAVDVSSSHIGNLAISLGTSEPALRLLLSIFLGYPLALFHRKFLYGQPGLIQHLYFVVTGIFIGYFNYGCDVLHPLSAIIYTYLIIKILNGSLLALQLSFIANCAHLLIGYYQTGTDDYDIKWTMPHCVLILRLIGYSFNVYDGTQHEDKLSNENKNVCLKEQPGFIQYCAFMCFPASFLVGPQFPYKRYENFINGKYRDSDNENDRPDSIVPGLKRLGIGIAYLSIFQLSTMFLTESFILSDAFTEMSFIRRLIYLACWARCQLYKYISCWLISEGALIMFSLSHNGKNENNVTQWNGCENVKLFTFENATEFNHYIQSFNINTNQWSAQYIYKRLKFLGNRYLSQVATLTFLAVWHGFHSGYYVTFLMEFIVMFFEKDLQSFLKKHEGVSQFLSQYPINILVYICLRIYTFIFMGWCLTPFVFLKYSKYMHVYSSINYIGIIMFVPWLFVYKPILSAILGPGVRRNISTEKVE